MPIIFSEEEKEKLRNQMLDIGFELIKEHGTIHASVDKVTKAVGIGRTTFYGFFKTKEQFLIEIVNRQRFKGRQLLVKLLGNRQKMTADEGRKYLKYLMMGEQSIYQYLTQEDKESVKKKIPDAFVLDLKHEKATISGILSHIEGVKEDIDYALTANIMKVIGNIQCNKETYHKQGYNKLLNEMMELLYSSIF